MNSDNPLSAFRTMIEPEFPGYLCLFNIAALKQWNQHHDSGYPAGDQEIADFREILDATLINKGKFTYFGGGEWCVFISDSQLDVLDQVIESFIQEPQETAKAGWRCEAIAANGIKARCEIWGEISLRRGVRCGFIALADIEEFEDALQEIQENMKFLPVNIVRDIRTLVSFSPTRWSCIVGEVEDTTYYCPFCRETDIEWEEGSESGGGGFCKNCRAKLEYFRWFP